MEAERYVVRELEGYTVSLASPGSTTRPHLEVSVLDSRHNYRIVQAFRSELLLHVVGQGRGRPARVLAYEQARAQAAALAARLNEATP